MHNPIFKAPGVKMQRISEDTYHQKRKKTVMQVRLFPDAAAKYPEIAQLAREERICRGIFIRALLHPGPFGATNFRIFGQNGTRAVLLAERGRPEGYIEFSGDKMAIAKFIYDFHAETLRAYAGMETGLSGSFGHASPYGWKSGHSTTAVLGFTQCFSEAISQDGGSLDIFVNGRVTARDGLHIELASLIPGSNGEEKVLLEALKLGLQ